MHSYNPKPLAAYNNTGDIPIKYVFVMTSTQRFRISLLVRAISYKINYTTQNVSRQYHLQKISIQYQDSGRNHLAQTLCSGSF